MRIERSSQLAIEVDAHKFVADASCLGIAPGAALPRTIGTDLGNGQPFILQRVTAEVAEYRQDFGCITLTIFND